MFANSNIVFIGDSMARNVYHMFNHMLDPLYVQNSTTIAVQKHINQKKVLATNVSVVFLWAPELDDVITALGRLHPGQQQLIVTGVAAWDALYVQDLDVYKKKLDVLSSSGLLPKLAGGRDDRQTVIVWLQPTIIIEARLNTGLCVCVCVCVCIMCACYINHSFLIGLLTH